MLVRDPLHRRLARATEPQILFPLIAACLLAALWGTTLSVIKVRQADAEHAAAASSRELLGTYEAEVVRALREIDQALKLVKFWPGRAASSHTISDLKAKGLLPPDLLFVVSIADAKGVIVESTGAMPVRSIAGQAAFREQRDGDVFFIGQLPRGPTGEAKLQFSRRLSGPSGQFDGVVLVEIEADYFVRRTGDALYSGDAIDYASTVAGTDDDSTETAETTNSWDGVLRWTSARKLYGFPLAVVVGLSVNEQLTGTRAKRQVTLEWAAVGSVLVVLLAVLLGRMSRQLVQARLREGEADSRTRKAWNIWPTMMDSRGFPTGACSANP